jgi:hypothetical protein
VITGYILPAPVVAELELNSVNLPPDIVEEENVERFLSQSLKKSQLKLKSTQNLSK